jgi:hypothetical protein
MEDEHGPINVIVKPDVYKRDRSAVRMEPFLAVRGRLQKDGATINVIAHEIEALRVPGAPVRRRGLSRGPALVSTGGEPYEPALAALERTPDDRADVLAGRVREGPDDLSGFHASLPDPLEYWADPGDSAPSAFQYLTALRQSPPGIKSFG